ncbi:pantothenate transporter [Penicillium macrosclerotiorum]|uniref:pantothenate transporter n=1 Tax=Penicillium macrosclerotiorum TaxID=303699 RepID=UPI002548FCB7|nr:pantothenate transporter [Penicillium macrosclerotiorum]KAJ5689740.1 pantothenate transporter [Penicillium macrosclerotiorum]
MASVPSTEQITEKGTLPCFSHVNTPSGLQDGFGIHNAPPKTLSEKQIEKRLLWKIDCLILPTLAVIYFLAAMVDRGDMGNASIAGMKKALHLTPSEYANAVAFFYIGYIVFQLPGSAPGLRVAIGAAEAFVQAAPLYLTLWYKREEIVSRAAIFFSMMALAGSANGLIEYDISESLEGAKIIATWQWIFIIEGRYTTYGTNSKPSRIPSRSS